MQLIAAGASRIAENRMLKENAVIEKFDARSDWLARRRQGIGGSDISAIIGVNPFETRAGVLNSKLHGRDKRQTDAMVEGTILEPMVVLKFSETEEGQQFSRIERNAGLFRRIETPYAMATPDAFLIVDDDKAFGILETKTAVRIWTREKIEMATVQNLWYQYVTGAEFGYIACLERRTRLHVVPVPRDEKRIDELRTAAAEFWAEFEALNNGTNKNN